MRVKSASFWPEGLQQVISNGQKDYSRNWQSLLKWFVVSSRNGCQIENINSKLIAHQIIWTKVQIMVEWRTCA
ncbi:MAG: hypothetical protein AAB680_00230 [Pseudomonadota bacterium]